MNARQTIIEANRQIRLLMQDCTLRERGRLKKYLKPVPELPVTKNRPSSSTYRELPEGVKHISEILRDMGYSKKKEEIHE